LWLLLVLVVVLLLVATSLSIGHCDSYIDCNNHTDSDSEDEYEC